MKKEYLIVAFTLSVSLILLSVAVPVNHSSTLPSWRNGTMQADGIPLPPPKPPKPGVNNGVTVADGIPLPPPKPPKPGDRG
jgi:hypothetical protein